LSMTEPTVTQRDRDAVVRIVKGYTSGSTIDELVGLLARTRAEESQRILSARILQTLDEGSSKWCGRVVDEYIVQVSGKSNDPNGVDSSSIDEEKEK